MSLNFCTAHSAQRYTWSSVHWVGSGGEEDTCTSRLKDGLASFLGCSHLQFLIAVAKMEGEGLGDLVTSDDVDRG